MKITSQEHLCPNTDVKKSEVIQVSNDDNTLSACIYIHQHLSGMVEINLIHKSNVKITVVEDRR